MGLAGVLAATALSGCVTLAMCGVSMTRGLNKPEVPPTPHDKLAADVQAELAPYEAVLAGNPKDQA